MSEKILLLGEDYLLNCREMLTKDKFTYFLIPRSHLGMYSWLLKPASYYRHYIRLFDLRISATTVNISQINWFALILIRHRHPKLLVIGTNETIRIQEIEVSDLLEGKKRIFKTYLYRVASANTLTRNLGKLILGFIRAKKRD